MVSQLGQDMKNRAALTAFQFRILPVVLGRVERGRIRKNWMWLRKHGGTLNKKASGRVCSMRVYSVCMINTQKSEMVLQIGKTICHFQVGMTLELIDLNCNKEILTLVVGKSVSVWQVKGSVGQGSGQCLSSFSSARRELNHINQSNFMPLAVGASQQALACLSRYSLRVRIPGCSYVIAWTLSWSTQFMYHECCQGVL